MLEEGDAERVYPELNLEGAPFNSCIKWKEALSDCPSCPSLFPSL